MHQRAAMLFGLGAVVPAAASVISGSERSWASPQETDFAQMAAQQLLMGFSPKPTPAPQPRGVFGRVDLMPRLEGYTMGPATCGFVQSNGNSFTCVANTATCASVNGYLGCCQPNQQCSKIQTVCVDYAASQAGKCSLLSDFHTVCCSSTAPACFTYLMKRSGSGKDAGNTYTAIGCYTTSGTAVLLDYDPAWSRTHSFPPSTTSSTKTSTTTTSPTATETGGGGGGGGGGSSTNVGAIAGGAVGGVAALGLIGTAIFFLLRRNKKGKGSDTQSSPPPPPMAQSQPQSPPQGYPPSSPGVPQGYPSYSPPPQGYDPHMSAPPQGYDPHMSVYSQQPYSPNSGYQQYPPGFQGQYPLQQHGGYPQYGAAGFPAPSTGSPPPHTTPSPNVVKEGEATSPQGTSPVPHHQQASELAAVNPLGNESNRAELS